MVGKTVTVHYKTFALHHREKDTILCIPHTWTVCVWSVCGHWLLCMRVSLLVVILDMSVCCSSYAVSIICCCLNGSVVAVEHLQTV